MRSAIALWLLATAASANVTLGRLKEFAEPPLEEGYGVVALIPREDGVSAFYFGDSTLYQERVGDSAGKTVLTGVDRVGISNGTIAFESAGTIYTAPLRDDDSVDFDAARVIAQGSLYAFACNQTRCLAEWREGTVYRAQIVGGPQVALTFINVLAADPNGFLVSVASGKLHRVRNDGADAAIDTPTELGSVVAADFDGARYTVVGMGALTIAAASLDLDGTFSRLTMVVDRRSIFGPYRSNGAQIAWNGTTHLIVAYWSNDFVVSPSFAWPIYAEGYRFMRDLQPAGEVGLGGTSASPAAITFAHDRFWVLWYDLPLVVWSFPGRFGFITGATLANDGTRTQLGTVPPPLPRGDSLVGVAASDTHLVGLWSDQSRISHRYRIHAKADGEASITVGESASLSAAAASLGDTFLVAMQGDDGIEGKLYADGAWTTIDLSALGKGGGGVAVAANDTTFLVATVDRGRLVATPGRTDLGAADDGSSVAAASDGDGFALLSTRGGASVVTILDAMRNVIATREIGPAATKRVLCWSGSNYVAIGMIGSVARTWRLSRYGDVVQTFDTERGSAEPISIARAGAGVVATWYSYKSLSTNSFATTLGPRQDSWDAPVKIDHLAATTRGNDALLFGWSPGLSAFPVLATRTLIYGARGRAAR